MRVSIGIVVIGALHVAVNGRTLCGYDVDEDLDGYSDAVALNAWNRADLDQCVRCVASLVARRAEPGPLVPMPLPGQLELP